MLFSSIPFLFYFLPVVLLVYAITPRRLKNAVLFGFSLVFYAWGEPRYALLMLGSITMGYIFGLLIEHYRPRAGVCRAVFALSVVLPLCALGYFKYADFFLSSIHAVTGLSVPVLNVALPIGISFYTFQLISYTADVYRGRVPAQKSYLDLAAYVSLFPQLIAGPIVRYGELAQQLQHRTHTAEKVAYGITRFVIGLGKKTLLANSLGELCASFHATADRSTLFYWVYAISFALQLYFDFSGYSDMAIGLGALFGFELPENFCYPYLADSITDFWRRWHISLGSWFRDYVYIPMGGSRVPPFRHLLNIFTVWMLTGLWHGAAWTFVLWGLYYALWLLVEKYALSPWLECSKGFSVLRHGYVLLVTVIGFVIFDAQSVTDAGTTMLALFGGGVWHFSSVATHYYLRSYAITLIIAIIGATPAPLQLYKCVKKKASQIIEPITAGYLCIVLLLCTAYLVDGSFNPFLYFRF